MTRAPRRHCRRRRRRGFDEGGYIRGRGLSSPDEYK